MAPAKKDATREEKIDAAVPQVEIDKIDTEHLVVPIIGTSPLIVHNFSDKSKRQMLEAQQGVKRVKENRDPKTEYQNAFYRTENGYGFPAVAFKAATVGSARFYGKSVTMVTLRLGLFFHGKMSPNDTQPLVEIFGEPEMREDIVRLGGPSRSADLRYRPVFNTWSTNLDVLFVKSLISRSSVLSLIDAGGLGVGVGEWRPEKNGDFGRYQIDSNKEIEVVQD